MIVVLVVVLVVGFGVLFGVLVKASLSFFDLELSATLMYCLVSIKFQRGRLLLIPLIDRDAAYPVLSAQQYHGPQRPEAVLS